MVLFARNELKPLLSRASSNDPELTSLQLSHRRITNRQLLQIADALVGNTHVAEIWLTNNLISDDGNGAGSVGYLMAALESNRTCLEVYLGGNKITAKGASSVAALLQKNQVITDIGLEDNNICDGGAKMLADALKHNGSLQTLKLYGNDIQTERTMDSINALLKKNRGQARERFEREHPEMVTHKIKKPEKKKERRRSSRRSGDKERSGGEGRDRRRSRSRGGRRRSRSRGDRKSGEGGNLEGRMSLEETNKSSSLKNKFRGMGLGKRRDSEGLAGMTEGTFV